MPPTQIHFESVKVDQLCSTSSHQGCAAAAVAGQSHTFSTVGIGIFWLMFSQCFFLSKGLYQSGYNATRFGIQLSNLFRVMFLQLGWLLCIVRWTVPFSDCLALWYYMTPCCFKPRATSCFKTLEPVTFWSQAHSWKNTMVLTTPPLLISNLSCAPASPFVSPDLQRASFTASTPIRTPEFSLLFTHTLPEITTFHTCSGVLWTIYFLVNTLLLPFKWPLLPWVYYTHL